MLCVNRPLESETELGYDWCSVNQSALFWVPLVHGKPDQTQSVCESLCHAVW